LQILFAKLWACVWVCVCVWLCVGVCGQFCNCWTFVMAAKIGPQSQSHGTKGRVCNHSTDFPFCSRSFGKI